MNRRGTGAIVLPYFGIATGLIAGIAAAVIVNRRRRNLAPILDDSGQKEPTSADGQ